MATSKKTLRTCDKGHQYYKSSDCPSCPTCEQEQKPNMGFLSLLPNPARRALEHEGITTLQKLSSFTEREILQLHGIGPRSMPILKKEMDSQGLVFKPGNKTKRKKVDAKVSPK
ncbi:RNA polymerase alpha subunit C-terminal domain-containing protein [Halalkalibacterium halodurans]|uniref:RNA polymerase alpha subunit C-terminal domain-containing protein n=1 Tax=Halalkalibacterium halodurans TaxID=86665 RepID=UPI002AA9D6AC|nr:RNA polymerase alpha subunit C-terminal domain-containing protein [Halalkalibacterium halodurans]MDY7221508.1 RNA polymerase alpha subunit C-terminal domain-containing protein [Halalkalibacterium halodurans]MDY7240784.1 RNA polymerase alpha subunit C-terminal domain-containing protein [Halalkalibacterium halodurans]MED4164567.1 RNA polymerase alpha subunit C-terminal domain-containing protein [Halalkalibacterium halodurans]